MLRFHWAVFYSSPDSDDRELVFRVAQLATGQLPIYPHSRPILALTNISVQFPACPLEAPFGPVSAVLQSQWCLQADALINQSS